MKCSFQCCVNFCFEILKNIGYIYVCSSAKDCTHRNSKEDQLQQTDAEFLFLLLKLSVYAIF